jgi:O-antigen ligase
MAMAPVVVVAALEAILGVVQAVGGHVVSGTYVNRDHYAGLLEMALPFSLAYPVAVWRGLDTRRAFPMRPALLMMAYLGAAVAILIAILSSLSRMGFVASLFSVLVMGIVAWRGNGRRSAGVVALLAVGLAGSFFFLPSDQLIARFAEAPGDITMEGRLGLWQESLQVVRAFPVFGCGMGGFESAFLRYKVAVPMVSDDHTHNDYLQFLIELGVVGFAIGAVLFTGVLARIWRATTRGGEPANRFLAIGCIGAFAAIGLHSVVDFNLYIPGNAMLLAWICGVASTLTPVEDSVSGLRALGIPVTIDVTPGRQ